MSRRKNDGMLDEFDSFAILDAIERWVKHERDRRIMIDADVKHRSFADIAEREGIHERTVSRCVRKWESVIYRHM